MNATTSDHQSRKSHNVTRGIPASARVARRRHAARQAAESRQRLRSDISQAAVALTPAAVNTAGHAPIFLARGWETPKLP